MKLLHLSDLHLGKRVNNFSMLEDQAYILTQILEIIDSEKPDAVLITGDVYDKAFPPAEAVELLDDFLVKLSRLQLQVFVSSGNHDSPERISFGSRLMDGSGIHLSPVYDGALAPLTLRDEFGAVNIYMLPFIKPANVRRCFPEETISSYTDALRVALGHMQLNAEERNVLMAHQFVTGALRSESEDVFVGGLDNVDAAVFDGFDYVALGHLHSPQNVGVSLRYCGSPLKYSFSEARQDKSVTVVELGRKGELSLRTLPLVPKRDFRILRGSYQEITDKRNYEGTAVEDYLRIILTDETDVLDGKRKLQVIYPHLMELLYDNTRTRTNNIITSPVESDALTPLQLFSQFYETVNNQPLSEEQLAYTKELIQAVWEDNG